MVLKHTVRIHTTTLPKQIMLKNFRSPFPCRISTWRWCTGRFHSGTGCWLHTPLWDSPAHLNHHHSPANIICCQGGYVTVPGITVGIASPTKTLRRFVTSSNPLKVYVTLCRICKVLVECWIMHPRKRKKLLERTKNRWVERMISITLKSTV